MIFLFFPFALIAQTAQKMGIIKVNENFAATCYFESEIDIFIIGNNPVLGKSGDGKPVFNYEIVQSDNTLIIRSVIDRCPETSLTVKLKDKSIFYGKVRYEKNIDNFFYDFRDQKTIAKNDSVADPIIKNKPIDYKVRLDELVGRKPEYSTIGSRENRIEYLVSNLMTDNSHTYMKVVVSNNSGNEYIIDGITFRYEEGKRKNVNKNADKNEQGVPAVYENGNKTIKAYSKENLGFVLPLYSVGEGGKLLIYFWEKNGTRNVKVEIPGDELSKIKVYN
jgi:hypothetical protein